MSQNDNVSNGRDVRSVDEQFFKTLFERHPVPVAIIEPDNAVSIANPAFYELTGCSKGDPADLLWRQVMDSGELEKLYHFFDQAFIDSTRETAEHEFRFTRKDDQSFTGLLSLSKLPDRSRRIVTLFDITEYKNREQELFELNNSKNKFFSIIAHELRNPFNAFVGLTDLIVSRSETMEKDRILSLVGDINKSAKEFSTLFETLLKWAHVQQGLTPFEPRPLHLLKEVSSLIASTQALLQNKEIEIKQEIAENLTVVADKNMFEVILRNLISNAIKYSHRGSTVFVSAKDNFNGTVTLQVKDHGMGMDKSLTEQLFSLTGETRRKGTEGEGSSGLGLLLVKEYVAKHNGKIWVESRENEGSVFYVTLPC